MSCYCNCHLGLSAQAIASPARRDHPWDAGDLQRCMNYCQSHGIGTEELRKRMAGRSPAWDALLPNWDELTGLLRDEMATRTDGRAPVTNARMREILDAARRGA